MTEDSPADDRSIERYEVTDADGRTWAVATHIPPGTPDQRRDTWVVDFQNGDRLVGEPANEVARLLMNAGDSDGFDNELRRKPWPENDGQANSIMETMVYDDDSDAYRITVRGTRVWFGGAGDEGDDVVLYQTRDCEQRTGVIEDAPFDSGDLLDFASHVRRHGGTA